MCYCSSMPQIDMERNREGVTRKNNMTSSKVRLVSTVSGHNKIIIIMIINNMLNVDQKKEKKLYNDNKYATNRYIL